MNVDLRKILDTKAPKISRWVPNFVVAALNRLIRVKEINHVLANYSYLEPLEFIDRTLEYMGVTFKVHGMETLNPSKQYIFASNHPLGGLDGMALARGLSPLNGGQVRVVVNDILMNLEPLRPIFAPINKHGRQSTEYAKMQKAMYESHANVVTFPAGLCSRLIGGQIEDLPWKSNFVQRAMQYNRAVVPVFVSGRNSMLFYRVALWRKRLGIKWGLEMILLPKEMFDYGASAKMVKHIDIYVGEPVLIDNSKTAAEWTKFIRKKSYELNNKQS